MKFPANHPTKTVLAYKVAFLILGFIPFTYGVCFLIFYNSFKDKCISITCTSAGDLVILQTWTSILFQLENAWIFSLLIWIILWVSQFVILKSIRLGRTMIISFFGFLLAIYVDYVLGLNSGPGAWYSDLVGKVVNIRNN